MSNGDKKNEEAAKSASEKATSADGGKVDTTCAAAASGEKPDLTDLPDKLLARVQRGDKKGRPFGTPRNPRLPTVEELNPRIRYVRAGDLAALITERKHGIFPAQEESVAKLSNEELLRFRMEDPISAVESGGSLSLTGGHHRTNEIIKRVQSGQLPPDTMIPVLVHD